MDAVFNRVLIPTNVFHHRAAQPIELPKICQALTIYSTSFMPQPPNALLLKYKGRL